MICPPFSARATESLSHAVNTYFSKSSEPEKHLGIRPGRKITPVWFHFINIINKLLTATSGKFYLKRVSLCLNCRRWDNLEMIWKWEAKLKGCLVRDTRVRHYWTWIPTILLTNFLTWTSYSTIWSCHFLTGIMGLLMVPAPRGCSKNFSQDNSYGAGSWLVPYICLKIRGNSAF